MATSYLLSRFPKTIIVNYQTSGFVRLIGWEAVTFFALLHKVKNVPFIFNRLHTLLLFKGGRGYSALAYVLASHSLD